MPCHVKFMFSVLFNSVILFQYLVAGSIYFKFDLNLNLSLMLDAYCCVSMIELTFDFLGLI